MARDYDKKKRQKDTKKKKDRENKKGSGAVIPRYRLWTKSILAPYPGEDGNPLYSGDLEPNEFLGEKRIAQKLHPGNCEWLARPGMAICLSAAALRAGTKEIARGPPEAVRHLEAVLTNTPNFKNAVKILDVGKSRVPDKKDIKNAVSDLVESFSSMSTKERQGLCDLVLYAAKLFLFSMHCLEAMDLLRNPKIYAKKMSRMPKAKDIQEEIDDWIKRPQDRARMKDMLTRALLAKIRKHQKENASKQPKKRRKSSTTMTARTNRSGSASEPRRVHHSSSNSKRTKSGSLGSRSVSRTKASAAASAQSSFEAEPPKKRQKQKRRTDKKDRENKKKQENDTEGKESSSTASILASWRQKKTQ